MCPISPIYDQWDQWDLMPLVGLDQLPVDEDAILLGAHACQEKFALLFNDDVVPLIDADLEFIAFGQTDRKHAKVFNHLLTIDANLQIAHELVKRKIDLMRPVDTHHETELH